MGSRSVIEWTDSTWNPWRGCNKVSPGCSECYMFRDQLRYGRDPGTVTRCADGTFYAPIRSKKWAAERDRCIAERGRHLVFTCSWSDWFHEDADEWRDEAWSIIRNTPESTYQILTKRPENIAPRLPREWGDGWPNVWLGVTIENRAFVQRAECLKDIPAAVRFVSAEPLLGPLLPIRPATQAGPGAYIWEDKGLLWERGLDLRRIDWVITGGESGGRSGRALVQRRPGRRGAPWAPKPSALDWVRDLRDACNAADVAFLHKQWGGPKPESGGRLLDGRTWDELPAQEGR